MTPNRLEMLRDKLRRVIESVEDARDAFQEHHPESETARQLTDSYEELVNVDERLRDAVRYHPEGDCPR